MCRNANSVYVFKSKKENNRKMSVNRISKASNLKNALLKEMKEKDTSINLTSLLGCVLSNGQGPKRYQVIYALSS